MYHFRNNDLIRLKGYTLVEIMIVMAVIGILAAIAIPGGIKARQMAERNVCIANLKAIERCVQLWVIDTGAESTDTPTTADLIPDYIKVWPECRGTAYEVPAVNDTANCPNNISSHTIE